MTALCNTQKKVKLSQGESRGWKRENKSVLVLGLGLGMVWG